MISQYLASARFAESGDRKQAATRCDAGRAQRPATAFEKRFANWLTTPVVWLRRIRLRAELASIDPRLLEDVGIDSAVVREESRKPFWRD